MTVFNDTKIRSFLTTNKHISMISEGSCDS